MALVERVMGSMQSPVLAFDPEGRLRLLNAAGEEAFGLRIPTALGHSAVQLKLERLLNVEDDEVISLGAGQHSARWVVKRTSFRLRGYSAYAACALRCQRGVAGGRAACVGAIDSGAGARD